MRGTSLRVLSNLAANSGMHIRRYDFVAAYLQGELLEGETVYCYPPPGYESKGGDGQDQICRILKNLCTAWLKPVAVGNALSFLG